MTDAQTQKRRGKVLLADTPSLHLFVSPSLTRPRRGFTLIEMLTTVAVLIIVLGLMVDLAGYVRNRSANDLTRQVLAALDATMNQYLTTHKTIPQIAPFTNDPNLNEDEDTLLRAATENN